MWDGQCHLPIFCRERTAVPKRLELKVLDPKSFIVGIYDTHSGVTPDQCGIKYSMQPRCHLSELRLRLPISSDELRR
jgi:hypothetical protein